MRIDADICFFARPNIFRNSRKNFVEGRSVFFFYKLDYYLYAEQENAAAQKNYSRRLRRKLFDIAKYKLRAAQSYDLYLNILVLINWILCGIFVDE